MVKPCARRSRIHSPNGRWNSTPGIVRPFDAVHPEVRTPQRRAGRLVLVVGRAQHQQVRVAEEDQLAAAPQQPRGFRDPDVGIAPDRGAVLADDEIAHVVAQRHVLGRRVHERVAQAELLLQGARGVELHA